MRHSGARCPAALVMLGVLAGVSCANGRNVGNAGRASGVATAAPTNGDGGSSGAPIAVSAAAAVQAPLPEELLRSLLGCWRLGDEEQWSISRTKEGGARLARRLLAVTANDIGYAQRAAVPSDISYAPGDGTLVFSTVGPRHALRFFFTAGPSGLTGSWASSHAPGAGYHSTGSSVTLRHCAAASK